MDLGAGADDLAVFDFGLKVVATGAGGEFAVDLAVGHVAGLGLARHVLDERADFGCTLAARTICARSWSGSALPCCAHSSLDAASVMTFSCRWSIL